MAAASDVLNNKNDKSESRAWLSWEGRQRVGLMTSLLAILLDV